MAVTSIWPIKGRIDAVINYARNPSKTKQSTMQQLAQLHEIDGVIEYAADEMKTELRSYVTCLNLSGEETAAKEFIETKQYWRKTDGRLCYHGYQSFRENEVDAETAHKISVELAKRLWGDRFQVLVATHCNTGHYHSHFVINSVSDRDGYKFYNSHEDYRRMREESDRLCREYGISVIEQPKGKSKDYSEWLAEKNGIPTKRDMIRADIDRAILASTTERQFVRIMTEMGYEFKTRGADGQRLKRPSLKPYGAKGFFRFQNLGEGYSLEEILDRVYDNEQRKKPFPEFEEEPKKKYNFDSSAPVKKLHGLHALYIRYCFELHIIKRHPTSTKRVHFLLREDLIKLDKLDAETRFLGANKLETGEQLSAYREEQKAKIEDLIAQRADLRNRLKREKRKDCSTEVSKIQSRVSEISKELKGLRKEVALCDDIELRSAHIRENLEQLEQEQENERKELNSHELLSRGSRSGRPDVSERR